MTPEIDETTKTLKTPAKADVIRVGEREISADFRLHDPLLTSHVKANAKNRWLKIGDLARVFLGRNTQDGCRRIRRHLSKVFARLLAEDEFLVYRTATYGRVDAVKLLDVRCEQERQAARPQLERMRARHEIASDKFEHASQVIARKEQAAI